MSSTYIEQNLSEEASNVHRALASLQEELEAVDWYNQRADRAPDAELKDVLLHNRNEEIEHASMLLEWLRRNLPEFDAQLSTYLFKDAPITRIEEAETADGRDDDARGGSPGHDGSLGIGKFTT
jgi:ferritin-like protein